MMYIVCVARVSSRVATLVGVLTGLFLVNCNGCNGWSGLPRVERSLLFVAAHKVPVGDSLLVTSSALLSL